MGLFGSLIGVVVVILAVGFGWLQAGGIADGTLPLFHLIEGHGFALSDMPDLKGKTVLVTGASSGLGLGVARGLALKGATVMVTARDDAKCSATLANLRAHAGDAADVSCSIVELLSLEKTKKSAIELAKKLPTLDMLVLNAGIMAPPSLLLSDDGLEQQFQVNHLSQFLLFQHLLPSLLRSAAPRVVTVSSIAHFFCTDRCDGDFLDEATLNDAAKYDKTEYYAWSKLCNILMARELSKRHPDIVAHAIHPGGVHGNLLRYSGMSDSWADKFQSFMYWDIDTAALTVLRPLVQAELGEKARPGRYFVPIARERKSSARAESEELARRLWEASESLVKARVGK